MVPNNSGTRPMVTVSSNCYVFNLADDGSRRVLRVVATFYDVDGHGVGGASLSDVQSIIS